MTPDEIAEMADDLRDGMLQAWDSYGWTQGKLGDTDRGMCAIGAWNYATSGNARTSDTVWLDLAFMKAFTTTARNLFPDRHAHAVINFNDDIETSEEDVRLVTKHSFEMLKDMIAIHLLQAGLLDA